MSRKRDETLDAYKLLLNWTPRTLKILRFEKRKLGVDKTYELERSLDQEVTKKSEGFVEAAVTFLVRGRFVDMGAGKKNLGESRTANLIRLQRKARMPKKWYSRAFWGRLNDLQGAIGFQLMESAVQAVKAMEMRTKVFKTKKGI